MKKTRRGMGATIPPKIEDGYFDLSLKRNAAISSLKRPTSIATIAMKKFKASIMDSFSIGIPPLSQKFAKKKLDHQKMTELPILKASIFFIHLAQWTLDYNTKFLRTAQ